MSSSTQHALISSLIYLPPICLFKILSNPVSPHIRLNILMSAFLFLFSYLTPNTRIHTGLTTVVQNVSFTFNDIFQSHKISVISNYFIQLNILATPSPILSFSCTPNPKHLNLSTLLNRTLHYDHPYLLLLRF